MESVLNNHLVNPDQMDIAHPSISMMQELAGLFSNGQFSEVITKASELQKLFPESHLIPNAIGCAFLELGQLEKAAKQFQIAIRINDEFADPYYNLAVIHKRRGNLVEARRKTKLAIKFDNNMAKAFMLDAQCCERLHFFSDAIKNYRFAARDNSTKYEAMLKVMRPKS